ncbi:MAG TPA: class I SAM-dependent methyltransferase [Longimicrobiales bacterium]|nr:class I SAM-dependent methyltransferase [Longimicrobiales bacterium]
MHCPLCGSRRVPPFATQGVRRFLRCGRCDLIFLDPAQRLGPGEERARYETHRNDPRDPDYRTFLDRLFAPLLERLAPGARGLDYGSGPGPTLSRMLTEAGHPTVDYDPFFARREELLDRTWDFVTCSETAEHFFDPGREFRRLDRLLAPGGWLGLMTGIVDDTVDFGAWWYARDPTHVAFYSQAALAWIAEERGWELHPVADTVVFFRKPAAASG